MQQALSSCTGFCTFTLTLSFRLVFSLFVPFFTAYAVLFTFLPLTNTITHTARCKAVLLAAFVAFSRCFDIPVLSSYLLLHFRYASCCAKWLLCCLVVLLEFSFCRCFFFFFFSQLWLLLCCTVFFFSCRYFHVFFLAQHAFSLAQNDLFHFLELTNTAKGGWNGNFVQIYFKDDPAQTIRSRFTKLIRWLNCKGI